jgi:zinc protease
MGVPGLKRTDPDYFPLLVGNHILGGGGFSSRLTDEVREKRGLVYGVSSYFLPLADQGPYLISLQTKKEQTSEALKVVRETIAKFLEEGPTEKELQHAKSNIIGSFPLRIDSNKKLLDYVRVIGFYNLPPTYLDDYPVSVDAVTLAQIKDAFKRRIDPQRMVSVVVGGPAAK